uniref:EGF-like domain-containing protein n=1 Tax=Plectus sambesii TaxID=2011161 RepID=A0A914XMN0_9BILA
MIRQKELLTLFSVAFCLSVAVAQRNETTAVCSEDQFYCQDTQSKCIPLEWVCDNVKDCPNGKDEANCRYLSNCPDGYLLCRNYACVAASLKCDGFDDCLDGSDERGCPAPERTAVHTTCPRDMFQCRRGPCISLAAVCDGRPDCPEQDDEDECNSKEVSRKKGCNPDTHFTCEKDGNCVPISWLCDGMEDCNDGSDEHFCVDGEVLPHGRTFMQQLTVTKSNCTHEEFRCSGGDRKCIPLSKLCNKVNDCPGGDDEGGFCGSCATYGCERVCVDSPLGPTCRCGSGERVGDDTKSCIDEDECLEHGEGQSACEHICTNTKGSFTCSCAPGYSLNTDGRRCTLNAIDEGRLLVSLGNEVRTIPLSAHSKSQYGILMSNQEVGGMIHGLDYSSIDQRLYMTVSSVGGAQGSIHSYFGRQKCIVDHLTGVSNVAVDWITGNIYYTAGSPSRRPGVGVCTNDGRFCRLLVSDNEMHRFRGLALHPRRGLMFWSDWGSHGPKIEQSSMNGDNRKTLIDEKLEWPNGLTMDYVKEYLYFTDAQLQSIERVDIFTGRRSVVTTQGVHHPFDTVVFDGHLFWTDWHVDSVLVTSITNVTDRHIIHSLPDVPYGMAIDHPAYHQIGSQYNPCQEAQCSHMCLLTSGKSKKVEKNDKLPTASCVCPDHYFMQGDRCTPFNETERRKRDLDKAPEICMSLLLEYCAGEQGCFNGGECIAAKTVGGKMSSVSCECPSGYVGHYCEVALVSDSLTGSSGGGIAALIIVATLLVLLLLIGCCYARRSGISPDSIRKGPLRNVSMKTPLMVRFATSNNKDNSDKQRILASEETETETDTGPRSVSPVSSRHAWTAPESFANPMYDENNPYAPTTAVVDDVFDASVHPSPPKKDNDSGLGSASVLLNV